MTWDEIPGLATETITPFYARMVRDFNDGAFVEIGNWMGRSVCFLGSEIKRAGKGIKVYAVDHGLGNYGTNQRQQVKQAGGSLAPLLAAHIRACDLGDVITQVTAESVVAARQFEDGSLAMVFIDGDHRHATVSIDIETWRRKVRPGGILAGHDYGRSRGVTDVVNALFPAATIEADVWSVRL